MKIKVGQPDTRADLKRLAPAVRTAALCASRAIRERALELEPHPLQAQVAASSR